LPLARLDSNRRRRPDFLGRGDRRQQVALNYRLTVQPNSVEQVPPGMTYALRQRVLRPHQTILEMAAGDHADDVAFAAFTRGLVVGTALLMPEPCPWLPDRDGSWRLRSMAVDPEQRGQGIGRAVLDEALGYVRTQHGSVVWCSARVPARAFYERAGFVADGEVYQVEHIGPHIHMWRELSD